MQQPRNVEKRFTPCGNWNAAVALTNIGDALDCAQVAIGLAFGHLFGE